ncbi:hypothetical protein ANN_26925 [Periplaneta americana]|uniref:Uncharacterized protein n=1 Tax=Periplaneta americana TaxID=6978 RepID=A0ABQ8RWL4_PERAM|nr:hypothetical protein ANN_26925 [Periplaneta americana]
MLPLKPCRMKCLEKFMEEVRQKCFAEYWAIGNHDNRGRYISSLITISKPKTHRVVEGNVKLREIVCKYEIIIQGNNQAICRECFRRTFGETIGFTERVTSKKKESFSGIIAPDGRGKFAPANKTKMEDLQSAESHILSFPSYESHYCRNRNSKRIQKPKQDTCHKCDVLKMKIITLAGLDRDSAIQERDTHHKAAEESYEAKRHDKEMAQKDDRKAVLAFDLQQCLPTPYLTTSISFYKRQLWTFNLTVHNLVTNEATCFITKTAALFSFVIDKNPNNREIYHKILVSGHTHMECDADHVAIEREKKRTEMKINHPNDWYQLVRSCKCKKPFKVFVMEGQHFLDFNSLTKTSGPYLRKKVDTEGNKFLWTSTHWLKYTRETAKIFFKSSLSEEESFRELSIRRRGKSILPTSLHMIHEGPVSVSAEKKDILELLPLIDNVFHDFYKNLKVDNIRNIDPDLEELDADA